MALTPEQIEARKGKLTASSIGALVSGDKERIIDLWKETIGDPSFVPPNFDDNWPVKLGETTEALNLAWYEKKTGHVLVRRGDVVIHPDYDWAAATLDGFDHICGCPVEAKHVNGFDKLDNVIQRYMPQLTWQMECTNTKQCAISIIQGAAEPYIEYINYDKDYADELMARAHRFMNHVWMMTPPVVIEKAVPVYVAHDKMREINAYGDNTFASMASQYIDNKKSAADFKEAEAKLKEMMPNDCRRMYGYFIQLKRAKNGTIRITALD